MYLSKYIQGIPEYVIQTHVGSIKISKQVSSNTKLMKANYRLT